MCIRDRVDGNVNYDFQRSVGILKCNTHTLLPKFLYYYLNSPYIQNKLIKTSKGAIQKCLFINDLKNLEVSIPPIPLQKKISNTLALIDNKIKLNNKINAELENMAKTLYDYWFVQFDFPDENKRPYKSWFKRILKSILNLVFSNLQQGGLKYA